MGSKGNKQTQVQSTAQTYTPNPAIQQSGELAMNQAIGAAQTPFSMPTAPVAPFNPFQQQAFGQVQGAQGMTDPYFQQASQYINQSAQPLTDVSQYFNPMTSAVTSQLQNIFGQQNRQATTGAVQAAGGVGADRIGVAQGNLANQQTLGAGQVYSQLYGQAQAAAQADAARQQSAGYAFGQLGPAAQAANLQATSALGGAGNQQQQQTQQQLNAPYQNILAQLAYPFQTSQFLAGITGGLAPAFGGTTTGAGTSQTTFPTPSPLNQILGAGTSLAGLAGGAGLFGTGKGGSAGANPGVEGATGVVGGAGNAVVPTFFRRGGSAYADGGSDADSADASSPPPFPYLSLPKTGASPIPTIRLPMGSGQFHTPGMQMQAPQQQSQSSSSSGLGDVAKIAAAVLPFMLARGGSVNPYDIGQGFQEGGDTDPGESWEPEPIQGIDAPMGNTNPHWTMGDVAKRAKDFYGPKEKDIDVPYETAGMQTVSPGAEPSKEPQIDVPYETAGSQVPFPQASQGTSFNDRFALPTQTPVANVPLPRGNPTTPGGARSTMTNELAKAGMSDTGIGGISMNVADESKFNPFSRQPDQPRWGGEAHFAHGLFQEGGQEWLNYQSWLKKNHPDADWQDPALQTRFLAENLKQNYPQVWDKMANAKTPGEAAEAFATGYLKPAAAHLRDRVAKYRGSNGEDTTEISARGFPMGNRDMNIADYHLPKGDQPYPDALDRDWGQKFARSPWMSLVKAGAAMASTTGPVGTAIGHGFAAGAGALENQRKELRTEQDQNMKADHLFQQAKFHLDQYQRMRPGEEAKLEQEKYQWQPGYGQDPENPDKQVAGAWRLPTRTGEQPQFIPGATITGKSGGPTALMKNVDYMVSSGLAPDRQAAFNIIHQSVNSPAVFERLVQAQQKFLSGTPEWGGKTSDEIREKAIKDIRENQRQVLQQSQQGSPAPAAQTKQPQPMPASQKDLKAGELYMTGKGPATWNGEKFVQ